MQEQGVQEQGAASTQAAKAGQSLKVKAGSDVTIQIRFRVPAALNGNNERPQVARLDVIGGQITGPAADRNNDEAPQTRVLQRFDQTEFGKVSSDSNGVVYQLSYQLKNLQHSQYIRLRGTNQRDELEPNADTKGENPWTDLWFYSNPVFIEVGR
jgi:hypothetical protein